MGVDGGCVYCADAASPDAAVGCSLAPAVLRSAWRCGHGARARIGDRQDGSGSFVTAGDRFRKTSSGGIRVA